MWRFRLLLLPAAAVVELLLLAMCWTLAWLSPRTGDRLMKWATRTLPSVRWYLGE